jgi:serine/threonine protein kinase
MKPCPFLLSYSTCYAFFFQCRFLALERCLTSLHDYCCVPQLYHEIVPMSSDQEVLLQMAQGLHYIHLQKLIHRDVKPRNILISYDNPAVIKWADFGMSRAVVTGSKTFSWSKLQGTDRWLAPELITATQEKKIKGSQKCDIFSLGCVFFFFLIPGVHPFGGGDDHSTKNNIKDNNRVNFHRK